MKKISGVGNERLNMCWEKGLNKIAGKKGPISSFDYEDYIVDEIDESDDNDDDEDDEEDEEDDEFE